jgi:hypothetical protein
MIIYSRESSVNASAFRLVDVICGLCALSAAGGGPLFRFRGSFLPAVRLTARNCGLAPRSFRQKLYAELSSGDQSFGAALVVAAVGDFDCYGVLAGSHSVDHKIEILGL